MFLNHKKIFLLVMVCFLGSCAAPPKKKPIPISEQIVMDMQKSKDLMQDFQRKVIRVSMPEAQEYLTKLAQAIARNEQGFEARTVEVRIHQDTATSVKRMYAFPGTTIFVPQSLLTQVEFENELAAGFAYQLAQVIHRLLAKKLDQPIVGTPIAPVLFGPGNVFDFDREERKTTIIKATELLYKARFDTRGLPSFFQRYSSYLTGVWNPDSDLEKKEVEFNLKEARKAMSSDSPLRDPIVRSHEFILFKKRLSQ